MTAIPLGNMLATVTAPRVKLHTARDARTLPTANVLAAPLQIDAQAAHTSATWMAGDFGKIAQTYAQDAAAFVARLHLQARERVLDIACGTGNVTIPAARTGAWVTAVDIAPNMLAQAAMWAAGEGLNVRLHKGNAAKLPYADGSFDTVVSMFGVMFAPHVADMAAELVRVTRRGGRIAIANWTAEGFVGQMFRIVANYAPSPAGVPSPLQWGASATVAERLGSGVMALRCIPRTIEFRLLMSVAESVDYFRTWYAPLVQAFAALDVAARDALHRDLVSHWTKHNRAQDGTTRVHATYLEVTALRR